MAGKKKSKKKKAKRPGANYRPGKRTSKRGNPGLFGMGKKRHHRRRTRNPFLPIPGGEFGKGLVGVVVGGAGARIIPENLGFLQKYNSGVTGYGLNIAATFALAKALRYFMGAKAEEGAWYGGILMTVSRFVSDRWGKTIVQFGNVRMGNDPSFNFRRLGMYVSSAASPLPPLPVPTAYASSGPVPPLPVGSVPMGTPTLAVAAAPVSAKAAMTQPTTIAAASSMGAYGASRYGRNRWM